MDVLCSADLEEDGLCLRRTLSLRDVTLEDVTFASGLWLRSCGGLQEVGGSVIVGFEGVRFGGKPEHVDIAFRVGGGDGFRELS